MAGTENQSGDVIEMRDVSHMAHILAGQGKSEQSQQSYDPMRARPVQKHALPGQEFSITGMKIRW